MGVDVRVDVHEHFNVCRMEPVVYHQMSAFKTLPSVCYSDTRIQTSLRLARSLPHQTSRAPVRNGVKFTALSSSTK